MNWRLAGNEICILKSGVLNRLGYFAPIEWMATESSGLLSFERIFYVGIETPELRAGLFSGGIK